MRGYGAHQLGELIGDLPVGRVATEPYRAASLDAPPELEVQAELSLRVLHLGDGTELDELKEHGCAVTTPEVRDRQTAQWCGECGEFRMCDLLFHLLQNVALTSR